MPRPSAGGRTGRDRTAERGDAAARVSSADFAIAPLDEADTPRRPGTHLAITG